jgi:hypothetical protein
MVDGGWSGVDSKRDARKVCSALGGLTGEVERVGFNAECTEFTEEEPRRWRPPTLGYPQVMK